MDFKTFEELFTPFCQTPHIKSGKAKSYYNAIIYLAEFLNVKKLTRDGVLSIIHKESYSKQSIRFLFRTIKMVVQS